MTKLLMVAFMIGAWTLSGWAASSGTLTLSGTVPVVNNISITPGANATALNIAGGNTGLLVATVSETSNNLAGYKITMYSANAGKLIHSVDASKFTTYQVAYAGGAAMAVPASSAPAVVKNVASLTALTTATSNVNVNVTALPTAVAGNYADTVTFSIVAN